MVKNFWKEIKYLILHLDMIFFCWFWGWKFKCLLQIFKYVFQKINVARYARNVVTWDFLSDFQTLWKKLTFSTQLDHLAWLKEGKSLDKSSFSFIAISAAAVKIFQIFCLYTKAVLFAKI